MSSSTVAEAHQNYVAGVIIIIHIHVCRVLVHVVFFFLPLNLRGCFLVCVCVCVRCCFFKLNHLLLATFHRDWHECVSGHARHYVTSLVHQSLNDSLIVVRMG